MMLGRRLILLLGLVVGASGFLLPHTLAPSRVSSRAASSTAIKLSANPVADEDEAVKRLYLSKEEYLAGLPEQGKSMKGAWEYVLVERMEKPTQTSGGLFLPANDKDPLYIVRIVSVGNGVVGESGVTAPTEGLEPGDIAFTKQPWGIGPRDDMWETRKFSFVRAKDILARIG